LTMPTTVNTVSANPKAPTIAITEMIEAIVKYRLVFISALLALSVLALYWPVLGYEFIEYDDDIYVTDNPQVKAGLNYRSIRWAFTTGRGGNWHPLTWLSHMLDCSLFALWAGGHHLTNLLFHLANTVLLFLVLKRLTAAVWASAFVAFAFALHPLHVESVAWVAERKDLLSTLFLLLTIWAYCGYVKRPNLPKYLLVALLFALGLLAKPMLVTLPFVLLLLDFWPLQRLAKVGIARAVLEKVPLFFLSAVSSVVTFLAQQSAGATVGTELVSFKFRIANAIVSYITYIEKMFWPSRLAILYLHPADSIPPVKVLFCSLLLLSLTAAFIFLARRRRYLAVGWFWYLGALVPVIGLVQVGSQAWADRYSYVPLTGLFIILVWSVRDLTAKWRHRKIPLAALMIITAVALACAARVQLRYWQDGLTLWDHTLKVTPNNAEMHNGFANLLLRNNNFDAAEFHYTQALLLDPSLAKAHYNLAFVFHRKGRLSQAVSHYRRCLKLQPAHTDAHNNLGLALKSKGRLDEALHHFQKALDINPDDPAVLYNLGIALAQKGRLGQAVTYLERALAVKPDFAAARKKLQTLLEDKQNPPQ